MHRMTLFLGIPFRVLKLCLIWLSVLRIYKSFTLFLDVSQI